MQADFLSPKTRVTSGAGAVAQSRIAAGETVAAFGGRCVTGSEVAPSLLADLTAGCVQIDDDLFLVPGDERDERHSRQAIRHSCRPNCGLAGGVVVVAMRDIAPDEALTIDRATCVGSDAVDVACHCAAPNCRGRVTGDDWMLPELQIAYRGFFSPFLAKRIASLVKTGAERRVFAF